MTEKKCEGEHAPGDRERFIVTHPEVVAERLDLLRDAVLIREALLRKGHTLEDFAHKLSTGANPGTWVGKGEGGCGFCEACITPCTGCVTWN